MPSTSQHLIRIVTRTSALAMWQAEYVRQQLIHHHNELDVKIIGIKTSGDISQSTNMPLYKIGGKSLFVKELEEALLAEEADIAVHSLKDVPAAFPSGLGLTAICERENPFDAWVCPRGFTIETLPSGAKVGTSSLRRMVQLRALRPDLEYTPLRGNVDTRLRKCKAGEFDAIVLAAAGLKRLNLMSEVVSVFAPEVMLPAVGQGALGIECRLNDDFTREKLSALNHTMTQRCVDAERAMNAALGGNCQIPVAGFAEIKGDKLFLRGKVGHPVQSLILTAKGQADISDAVGLGLDVANQLIADGAKEIIAESINHG